MPSSGIDCASAAAGRTPGSASAAASRPRRSVAATTASANGDAAGLSRLAYDPLGGGAQMTLAQSAANAQATINGIAVESSSNTLDSVIDGITFNLGKVTTQPVTVNVTRNTDAIKTMVGAFVAAYNQLNSFLSEATRYDPATKQAALLQGDGTTTGIQNQLHMLMAQNSGASSTFVQIVVRAPGRSVRVLCRATAPSFVRYVMVASTGAVPGL